MTPDDLKYNLALHGHKYKSSLLLLAVIVFLVAVGVVMGRIG